MWSKKPHRQRQHFVLLENEKEGSRIQEKRKKVQKTYGTIILLKKKWSMIPTQIVKATKNKSKMSKNKKQKSRSFLGTGADELA